MPFAQPEREPHVHYLLEVISSVLEELVRAGEQERALGKTRHNRQVSKFNGLHPTPITIAYYLQRIAQFSGCSDQCFVLMLIYIDRLVTKKNIALDAYNVHRLIISAILLSAKFFDDHFFFNPHFALVGGLKEREMNTLELEFLFLIEFNLYVTAEDYQTYYNTLARMAHTRFMNKTLPPIPNIPHKESNLPQPMPNPPERITLEDEDFVPIPLPENKGASKQPVQKEGSDGAGYAEAVNFAPTTYGQQQPPAVAQANGQLDLQWVHVSSADVSNKSNYVNSVNSFNDFTIVNKSPEEYDYSASRGGVNMNTSVYPHVHTNNHHVPHNGMVPGATYSDNILNNGYVQQYPRTVPHPAYPANFGYGVPVQKHSSQMPSQEVDGADPKQFSYPVYNPRNTK